MKFRFVGQTDHARRHADFIARQGRNRGFVKRGFRFFRYFFEGWRLRHRGRFRRGARHQGHRESKQRTNCNLRDNHVEFPQHRRRGAMPQESRLHVPTQGRSVKCGQSRKPVTLKPGRSESFNSMEPFTECRGRNGGNGGAPKPAQYPNQLASSSADVFCLQDIIQWIGARRRRPQAGGANHVGHNSTFWPSRF